VAGTSTAGEAKGVIRLTVKEKVLLLLGDHLLEDEVAEFPPEMTQKGISDSFAIRRSHVAASLKGMVEDGLVEQTKGRVEGEQRRQNIYRLTPKGLARAREVRDKLVNLEVDFENGAGTTKMRVADLLAGGRLELPSVVTQLEKGSVLRPEINLVMRPERKLIAVYCPTCERSIEVENVYGDEEVGFDCPVCGRPYRITPGERTGSPVRTAGERAPRTSRRHFTAAVLIVGLFLTWLVAFFLWVFLSPLVALVVLGIVVAMLVASAHRPRATAGTARTRAAAAASIVASVVIVGTALVVLWGLLVTDMDFVAELTTAVPLAVAFTAGYLGLAKTHAGLSGEFLLVGGAFVILVMMLIPFVDSHEGFGIATAPYLATIGVGAILLSTLHHIDRELQVLDVIMAAGGFVLVVSFTGLWGGARSPLGAVVLASLMPLGAVMVAMRVAQPRCVIDLGGQFVAAGTLAVGLMFVALGLLMIAGGSEAAGAIEMVLVSPFVYYGLTKVFTDEWMYRVPLAALMMFVEVVVLAYALLA